MTLRVQSARLKFSILGEIGLAHADQQIPLGPQKQKLVLMALLSRRNRPVSVNELAEALWPGNPPSTAKKNLQVYVSNLRSILNRTQNFGRITHESGSYRIIVRDDEIDIHEFEHAVRTGREELSIGDSARAAKAFREALDVWPAVPAPPDEQPEGLLAEHARWVYEQYLRISENWAEAEIDNGNCAAVAERIMPLIQRNPLREGLFSPYLRALAGCGRRAEALTAYGDMRKLLAKELGISPSAALESLYQGLLKGEASKRAEDDRDVSAAPFLVPRDLRRFIGLDDEVRDIEKCIAERRDAILLWGMSGVGKTSLAVHVAHRAAEEFRDGRFFVQVRNANGQARNAISILREIFHGMGRPTALPVDQDAAVATWQRWLMQRRVLVIFDDVPYRHDIGPLLPMAETSVAVLTSRRHLADVGPVWDIQVPDPREDERLELIREAMWRKQHAVSRNALAGIAAVIPPSRLAAWIFGMKLSKIPERQLPQYIDSLDGVTPRLSDFETGGLSLRSSIASQWQDLTEVEQGALTALSREESETAELIHLLDTGVVQALADPTSLATTRYRIRWELREYVREMRDG